jgi:LysM repeat protein
MVCTVSPRRAALIVLVGLLAASLACNLSGGKSKPTATPVIPATSVTPQVIFITSTPTLPGVLVVTNTAVPAPTLTNCTPQTAWPVYTVAQGDTLGQIAQRTGTDATQLAAANCLANPELNPNAPVFQQNLAANPVWSLSGQTVTNSGTIRLDAGAVQGALDVTFFVGTTGAAVSAGQDVDPWDGAIFDYNFPAPGTYTFYAVARNEQAQSTSTSLTIRYDPSLVPPGGPRNVLVAAPVIRVEGSVSVLRANTTVVITWPDTPPGADRIDLKLTPTGGSAQTIGSDLNAADGMTVTWNVPAGVTGYLQAMATMPDGSIQSSELFGVSSE